MLKFLALGDSYTLGEGLPAESSWPWLLVKALRRRDVLMAAPEIVARTGWTSGELLEALQTASCQPPYDLVSLAVGVNNQYRGLSLADYQQDFATLLEQAIALAGRPQGVVVLSIPDWRLTPFAADRDRNEISREIRAFNQVNARLAYDLGIAYVNVTEISRQARYAAEMLAADGLHYSEAMYRRWLEILLPRCWKLLLPDKDMYIPLLYQEGPS